MKTESKLYDCISRLLNKEQIFRYYCQCGNAQTHSLVYCNKCGSMFANGFRPKTWKQSLNYTLNSIHPYSKDPVKYAAHIFEMTIKAEVGEFVESEVVKVIKKILKEP